MYIRGFFRMFTRVGFEQERILQLRLKQKRSVMKINVVSLVLVGLLSMLCYQLRLKYEAAYDPMRDCVMQFRSNSIDLADLSAIPYANLPSEKKAKFDQLTADQAKLSHIRGGLVRAERTWSGIFNASLGVLGLVMYGGAVARFLASKRYSRQIARIQMDQCIHCGYDLRGSTDRCPECGTAFQSLPIRDLNRNPI